MMAVCCPRIFPFFPSSTTFRTALGDMELISLKERYFAVAHEKRAPAIFAGVLLPRASENGGLDARFPHMP